MELMKYWLALTIPLVLAGCQNAPTPPLRPIEVIPDPIIFSPELGLSSKQRLSKAIKLLSKGHAGQAEVELYAYLSQVNKSKIANNLIAQIRTPVNEYFPAEFAVISLSNGESLSTIAKQYLGDVLQFYALAQYNNIKNPGKTTIGQIIHVPLTDKARAFINFKIDKGMDTSSTEHDTQARSEFQNQTDMEETFSIADQNALTEIEQVGLLLSENQNANVIQAYEQRDTRRKLNGSELQAIITAYQTRASELTDSDPKQASAYYLQSGNLIASTGDRLTALKMFNLSMQLNSSSETSIRRYTSLKSDLTNAYHRDASLAFRRQQLDKAIELWEILLSIDPGHVHATNNLLQAQKLKEKLQRLE